MYLKPQYDLGLRHHINLKIMDERRIDLIQAQANASELELPPVVVDEQRPLTLMYTDEYGTIAFFKDHQGQMWTYDQRSDVLSSTQASDLNFDPKIAGTPSVDKAEGKKFTNLVESLLYIKWIFWKTRLEQLESLLENNEIPLEDIKQAQTEKGLITEFLKKYSELISASEEADRVRFRTECESAFRRVESYTESYMIP
jgi:hypothetical protein